MGMHRSPCFVCICLTVFVNSWRKGKSQCTGRSLYRKQNFKNSHFFKWWIVTFLVYSSEKQGFFKKKKVYSQYRLHKMRKCNSIMTEWSNISLQGILKKSSFFIQCTKWCNENTKKKIIFNTILTTYEDRTSHS